VLYQAATLTVTNAGGGYAFNWPSYLAGFALQTTPVLGSGAVWSTVSGTPVISNGCYWLTASGTDSNAFFRLSR
jgi:hypothetical protein